MIEQKDNDELTAAYLAGCHATRKMYEQRLAEAEAKLPKFEQCDCQIVGSTELQYWKERAQIAEKHLAAAEAVIDAAQNKV